MVTPHISLSPELFAKAFPFHFVFNQKREILQAGDVLERISSESLVGSQIEQHFHINRPNIPVDFDTINKKSRSLFILEFLHNGMYLKGQMMYQQEQEIIFFLGSPWITDTANLPPLGIKLKDFAIHDPITDFLFLLQAKNTALADTEKLTTELTHQRTELQNALRIKEHLTKIAQLQAQKLETSLKELQQTQAQLIQAEKMSSLGQLVAGIAHEINNPVNFIYGNLKYINDYTKDLLKLVHLYQKYYDHQEVEIRDYIKAIELDFILEDLPKIVHSMQVGTERITEIVISLRNFSRLDEAEMKKVDIHQGIDSTLLILQNRLKEKSDHFRIEVIKNYGNLPLLECYPGSLNQVFMNIISNAIDALDSFNSERNITEIQSNPSKIIITTEVLETKNVVIRIIDNALGMSEAVKERVFDPFFTTKPVGKGTGLGLSISYQIIVEKHKGKMNCLSVPGKGTEFYIEIPLSINDQAVNCVQSLSLAR
ncbi:GHKL domain-containing protein [Fortiea sp. LEGE XX443]|uniref:sensor histidine kinase n=1 Tax=Fortiea sp. LEGE XX443 TaxID=1828611 RepID=UPI0018824AA1|nr:ATP-binding protein [Fortiea sp. LEGE XX443]MBE9006726.1 GHKL domain-containing protein [Fortiea sp. LEGE XX443]